MTKGPTRRRVWGRGHSRGNHPGEMPEGRTQHLQGLPVCAPGLPDCARPCICRFKTPAVGKVPLKEEPETPKAPAEDESLLSSGAVAQGGLHTGIRVSCTLSGKRTGELEHLSSPFGALEHSQVRYNPTGPHLDVGGSSLSCPEQRALKCPSQTLFPRVPPCTSVGKHRPPVARRLSVSPRTASSFFQFTPSFTPFCQSFTSLGNKDALLRALLLGVS